MSFLTSLALRSGGLTLKKSATASWSLSGRFYFAAILNLISPLGLLGGNLGGKTFFHLR
jgi:hypothetical protein